MDASYMMHPSLNGILTLQRLHQWSSLRWRSWPGDTDISIQTSMARHLVAMTITMLAASCGHLPQVDIDLEGNSQDFYRTSR